jgi:FkbM family methyltransferase
LLSDCRFLLLTDKIAVGVGWAPPMSVKHFVRKCLWRAGLDVRRFNPRSLEGSQLARQLSANQIDVVFDVGANTGQFAETLRDAGFRGRIVSFEPSTAAHSMLSKHARRDANWIIAPRMALGDHDGTTTLNLAGNSASSSVLPMLSSHVRAAPESRYIGSETVDLRTLDSIGTELATDTERIFLKLDVQGFEYNVLQGAEQFLRRVTGIQLELSLVPLYDGERLFHPMLHDLEERGYELWSVIPGFVDPDTSRLLQLDVIFFRKEPALVEGLIKKPESLAV